MELPGVIGTSLTIFGFLTGLVLLFLRHSIKGWVTTQFDKEKESFKHELNAKLEKTKADLVVEVTKAAKVTDKDFEVLPKLQILMESAVAAVGMLFNAVSRVDYSDVLGLSDFDYTRWVNNLPYEDVDLQLLHVAVGDEKTIIYKNLRFRYELMDAKQKTRDFLKYLLDHHYMLGELITCYNLSHRLSTFMMECEWEKSTKKNVIEQEDLNTMITLKGAISKQIGARLNFPPPPIPPR